MTEKSYLPCLILAVCCALLSEHVPAVDKTLVVTATRTPLALEDALAPVIVIDAEEIARTATFDILETLRFHAGLEIGRNGGPGQNASLFIRGGNSNHTLVLVDGVRINAGSLGAAALQHISPVDIERIEIVKGPRSSLYGSEAIGGVVNIITRRASAPFETAAEVGTGRWNTHTLGAGFRGSHDGVHGGLRVNRVTTDGFPTRRASTIDRGYENTTIQAHVGYRGSHGGVELRHWQADGMTEYLDFLFTPVDQDSINRVTTLVLDTGHAGRWRSTLLASRAVDEIDQNQSPDFAHTTRDTLDWQHDFDITDERHLQIGLYRQRERVSAEIFGGGFDERPDSRAAYLQYQHTAPQADTLLAARHTRHDAFGGHWTWNAEVGTHIWGDWRVNLGAGTGFRAPGSAERFGFGGNPGLDPERSRNLELGLRKSLGTNQRLGIQIYQNRIDGLITFDPVTFSLENIARARVRGVEVSHKLDLGAWRIRNAATVQQPIDLSSGDMLPRRARRSFSSGVVVAHPGDWRIGADLIHTSRRKDSGFSPDFNAGYAVLNLSATRQLSSHWILDLRLENALDADYETAAGFNSAGRAASMRLNWRN